MRASTDRIKAAILDADPALRIEAAYYFGRGQSSDPGLMPLIIQAFERFGRDAFEMSWIVEDLVQTDESIEWICRQIDQIDPDADDDSSDCFINLVAALRDADPALLERHATTIREMRGLDDDSKAFISDRIQLASLPPQDLWRRLHEFCQEQDQLDEEGDRGLDGLEDYDAGYAIVAALAQYPDQVGDEVLKILDRKTGEDCLEIMAVRLAGVMRLEAAATPLIDLLIDTDSWAGDGARWSLCRIGTDAVVKEMAARYAADEDLRPEIAISLARFQSDFCVQTCLELLDQGPDDELREDLIVALLSNFATEGIEPARQFVLTSEKTPEVLTVREDLLLACKMLETRIPEFDAWLEDSQHDAEFKAAWYAKHGPPEFFDQFGLDDDGDWEAGEFADAFDGEFDGKSDRDVDDRLDDQPPDTVVRHDEKIGRNDPCPCGSGKKYKKCCLHKRVLG